MIVFDDVAFGLRGKARKERPSEDRIRAKVKQLLELVQLDWLADRYPPQLSVIEAVMSNQRHSQLQLKEGDTLVVRPKRLHVFVEATGA